MAMTYRVLLAAAMLGGCIAVPDYSRSVEVFRFQAVRLVTIPGRGDVYLVQQCSDRPDLRQICSRHGSSGQYVVLRPSNWDVTDGFVKGDRDARLEFADYVKFVEATTQDGSTSRFQVGDFISSRTLWGGKVATLRVRYEDSATADFQTEANPTTPLDGASRDIGIQLMRPTVRCDSTVVETRIDMMILPLPQTLKSYEGPKRASWVCTPL